MNYKTICNLILPALLFVACTAESLKEQLVQQELAFERYIEGLINNHNSGSNGKKLNADSVFINAGVYRLVFISGAGEEAASGDSVFFHYRALNYKTKQYYDSTGQNPERAILGAGYYISGLEKGLTGMQTGEYAEILLTGEQAYGDVGMGILPPYTPVIFEVKMLKVVRNW